MDDAGVHDLFALDRQVANAAGRLARWRSAVLDDPEGASSDDPFDGVRRVSSKSARDALLGLTPSAADVPLRDELVRWVTALVFARIGLADDVAWARRVGAREGVHEGHDDSGSAHLVSWREAWRGAVGARSVGAARRWIEAATAVAPGVAATARTRAVRRLEIAARLGLTHPWDAWVPIESAALRSAAWRLLATTDELANAVRMERTRGGGLAETLYDAMARDTGEGWPARLSPWWFQEMFGAHLRRTAFDMPSLPEAFGASSFARGLQRFGFALRAAWAPSSMPFALAREPGFVAAHRLGFVFGGLVADAEFQARMLGIPHRVATAQARRLVHVTLLEARLGAARLLLGDDTDFSPAARFEEIGVRLFGSALDRRLCGAWPRAREDEPGRFVALLQAEAMGRSLREQFDDDWFRNPRAWQFLREQAETPAREPLDGRSLEPRAASLGLSFEEALG